MGTLVTGFGGSFGQAIPPNGPYYGYPGTPSRMGLRAIVARQVLPSTASNLVFGAGAIELSNVSGNTTYGYIQPFVDFLATPANAANLQAQFAGIAVREISTNYAYLTLNQSIGTTVASTTATATSGTNSLTVASATNIQIGQQVEGAGVTFGSTVTAVSGTTITISLNVFQALSSTAVSFTSPVATQTGSYVPGQMAEILPQYSVVVYNAYGTPRANQPVYIRTVANASLAGTAVGDFEAADDAITTPTTSTTVGSTTLTTSTGTGVAIGQRVTAPGIPSNTYLTAGSSTSWTMSNQATATTTTQTASFSNMALLGTLADPWLVYRSGGVDPYGSAEILIKSRHAA